MYCKECGEKLSNEKSVMCVKCGTGKGKGNNFCGECGTEVKNKSSEVCLACGVRLNSGIGNIANPFKGTSGAKGELAQQSRDGKLFKIGGWVCFVISLLFVPILFGAGAVVSGYLYSSYNKKHGTIIMIMGVAGAIFGTIIGMESSEPVYYFWW